MDIISVARYHIYGLASNTKVNNQKIVTYISVFNSCLWVEYYY